jgi:cyclic lactone autoinducer peptide
MTKRWIVAALTTILTVLAVQSVAGATFIWGYQPEVPASLKH